MRNTPYYPVCLDIKNRPCLVVGGGDVGTRKVTGLLEAGARVTVVGPELSPVLRTLAKDRIEWRRKKYHSADLDGMFLVFGATNDEALNQRIHADATGRNMLCNIADRPEVCNFILPSVVRRGDLIIAVSTSGKSPALAKKLRKDLENRFGEEYAVFLQMMGAVREQLFIREQEPEIRKRMFEALIEKGLPELLRQGDYPGADRILTQVLGPDFQLERLLKVHQGS